MYKFNYQYLAPEGNPFFTCIVPSSWLSLDLPTFGGDVIYQDKRARAETLTDFVFEFSEISEMHSSERIFTLKVETKLPLIAGSTLGDSRDLFGKTIKVRYLTDANKSTNETSMCTLKITKTRPHFIFLSFSNIYVCLEIHFFDLNS